MIYCEGAFVKAVPSEKKGFKSVLVVVDNELAPDYPDVIKFLPDDDYRSMINKEGIIKVPLYLDAYDNRISKYSPKAVQKSYRHVKA